jgi:hypothetical protein
MGEVISGPYPSPEEIKPKGKEKPVEETTDGGV